MQPFLETVDGEERYEIDDADKHQADSDTKAEGRTSNAWHAE